MGIIYGSYNAGNGNFRPYIEYSYTQNIDANTSDITATFGVEKLNDYAITWTQCNDCWFNIEGNVWNENCPFDLRPVCVGDRLGFMTKTVTVGHDADGTKTISLSATSSVDTGQGIGSVSGDITLDTIPRASSISNDVSFTVGNSVTANISTACPSFYHSISIYVGDTKICYRDNCRDKRI